jgi:hypothetical protein
LEVVVRHRVAFTFLAGAILLTAAAPAAAQDNALGVKVGVNFAKLSFDEDDFGFDSNGRTGLMAGVFISRELRERFGLQIEGLITQKGGRLDDQFFGDEFDVLLTYLEIPVLGRYTLPVGTGDMALHVYGGPAFAVKLSDKQRFRFDDEDDWDDLDDDEGQQLKGADVGLAVGAGVEFNLFLVDLRYTHGLVNINKDARFDVDPDDLPVKNRVFTISVGYRFR